MGVVGKLTKDNKTQTIKYTSNGKISLMTKSKTFAFYLHLSDTEKIKVSKFEEFLYQIVAKEK